MTLSHSTSYLPSNTPAAQALDLSTVSFTGTHLLVSRKREWKVQEDIIHCLSVRRSEPPVVEIGPTFSWLITAAAAAIAAVPMPES